MQFDQERPQLGYRGSVGSRAKNIIIKTVAVAATAVMLVSAFVLSLLFFALAFAVVLVVGGYFFWKTRELRKQMRARYLQGDVIEGVVVREVVTHKNDTERAVKGGTTPW